MGTIKLMTGIAFLGVFVMAIILFSFGFETNNITTDKLSNDSEYRILNNTITQNFTSFYLDANTILNETMKSTISSQTEATEGGTAFKVGPGTAMKIAYSSVSIAFEKVFGSGEEFKVFFTTLLILLAIVFALYIFKTWKGSPD